MISTSSYLRGCDGVRECLRNIGSSVGSERNIRCNVVYVGPEKNIGCNVWYIGSKSNIGCRV